jgi:hypothetical protein
MSTMNPQPHAAVALLLSIASPVKSVDMFASFDVGKFRHLYVQPSLEL